MTISTDDRKKAVKRALMRLADLCGDSRSIYFGEGDLVAANPFPTTVAELEAAGYVRQVVFSSNPQPYELTLEGWFEAQRVSGRLESEEFDARRGRLCAAMKDAVKGRVDKRILDCAELAARAGLPEGWVWNVLEAQVLYRLDPKGRYHVRFENGSVYVPVTFGQEPVDLA